MPWIGIGPGPASVTGRLRHADTMRVTQAQIAKVLSLSPSTVSRALNERWGALGISRATRDLVLSTITSLGFQHRASLNPVEPDVGLLIGAGWPYHLGVFMELPIALVQAANAHGWGVRILSLPDGGAGELRPGLLAGIVGIIITHELMIDIDLLRRRLAPVPIVTVNTPTDAELDQVLADDHGGMSLMVEHLLAQGHRHAVYCTSGYEQCAAILHDRLSVVQASGLSVSCFAGEAIELARSLAQARRSGRGLSDSPSVVICHSDAVATDLLARLHEVRIRVPDDISVVSGNDSLILSRLAPPVTAVYVPIKEMVHRAVDLLAERQDGDQRPRRLVRLPEHVILRGSVAAPGTGG